MRKKIKKILILTILLILYIYILSINSIPNKITKFQGEIIKLPNLLGININKKENEDTMSVSAKQENSKLYNVGKTKLTINLFNNIHLKDINLEVIPKTKVIPVGKVAGVKLYTNGVMVVGMSEIEGEDNKKYIPYKDSGIKEGDTIISIDNQNIEDTEDLIKKVNKSNGEKIKIKYIQENNSKECSITPVKTGNKEYKIGLWVRDSAAGIGTVSFYNKENNTFAALGHGIQDIDTDKIIDISSGEFVTSKILGIKKGEKGNPGKIEGTLTNQKEIGKIFKNTKFGIYGKVNDISTLNIDTSNELEVALRNEIKEGKAYILSNLENGKTEKFEIEIEKIYKDNNYNNKSMKIKITDDKLINKTGGIIQGMSGSPIIQNNKFVGAITHVLVNNPLEGYGVFGDIMIKELYKSKS